MTALNLNTLIICDNRNLFFFYAKGEVSEHLSKFVVYAENESVVQLFETMMHRYASEINLRLFVKHDGQWKSRNCPSSC